jgi:outer membrane protein assembly factor BamA
MAQMRKHLAESLLVMSCYTVVAFAQCGKDYRSEKRGGLTVTDFTIVGTTTLSSSELLHFAGDFVGSCYDDDTDEMQARLRAGFQERGYFAVEIKSMSVKPGDPLKIPKPVAVEAEVEEGARFTVAEITFSGNHAFQSEKLRGAFSLKTGDVFERSKIVSGIESLRKLYGSSGFLDFVLTPDTEPSSNGTMSLNVEVAEGPQYHMGKLEIAAEKVTAARLRAAWDLAEGAPYDFSYVREFVEQNHDLLPAGFTAEDIRLVFNCPEALVEVSLMVDPREHASEPSVEKVPCESHQDKSK